MLEDTDNSMLDSEALQMEKLKRVRQLTTSILKRRYMSFILVFLVCIILAGGASQWITKLSPKRYMAQTHLLFYPKSSEEIKPLETNQVMKIISRRTMVVKIAQDLDIAAFEDPDFLDGLFGVHQDKQNPNFFVLRSYAQTEEEALRRVNAYADLAVQEYSTYRLDDLQTRRISIERRRSEISEEFLLIDEEEKALNTQFGLASPIGESERLAQTISDNRKILAQYQFEVLEAEMRLKKVQDSLGNANPKILDEADTFRKYSEKLRKCDEEIETMAFLYTAENPKLAVALEEREKVARLYNALLEKYGMTEVSEADFTRIDTLAKQHNTTVAEIEKLNSNITALEKSLNADEEKLNAILKILPRYEGFKTRRNALKDRLNTVEAQYSDIRFLESTIKSEFVQLERADHATGESPFSYKKVVVILLFSAFVTWVWAMLVLILDFKVGRIFNEEELAFYQDIESVGSFGNDIVDDEDAFNRFLTALGGQKKVFLASMDDGELDDEFYQNFLHLCSRSGVRALVVDIVNARDFAKEEGDKSLVTIVYQGDRGWMPVSKTKGLLSMEIAMLKVDLAKLLNKFDLILLKGPDGDCPKLLSKQLTKICENRLILVHPGKTRRNHFRNFLNEHKTIKTMVLTVKSLVFLATLFLFTGCYIYPNRLTKNYEQYPLLIDEEDTIHKVEMTDSEKEERLKLLMELEAEPPEMYRINAGDKVRFTVYDHPELSTDATITPDGHIGVIFLGQVKVANLTLKEACDLIGEGLSEYIKKPMVSITPLEVTSQYCTISGGVNKPGVYPVSSDMRLSELYALAGGSGVRRILGDDLNIADFSTSYIFRDGKPLPVDFNLAINEGNIYHNVRLKKNDRIVIGSRSEEMVCVVGHVQRPSKQLFDQSIGLIEVLTNAGWLKEEYWPYIIIIRGGVANPKLYRVDIDAILAGKSPNVQLQSGDVVFVPQDDISEFNVYIRKLLPLGQLFNLLTVPFSLLDRK